MKQDPEEKTLPLPELRSEIEPSRKVPSGKFPEPTSHLGGCGYRTKIIYWPGEFFIGSDKPGPTLQLERRFSFLKV